MGGFYKLPACGSNSKFKRVKNESKKILNCKGEVETVKSSLPLNNGTKVLPQHDSGKSE